MKTLYILLLTLVSHLAIAQTPFITRWNLATAGSGDTQLTFGVETSGTVGYSWQEVSPGTASGAGTFTGSTATISGLPSGAVIDLSISPTNFNRFNINDGTDKNRLTDVRQWGTTAWISMGGAFLGGSNLQISATDLPNLSGVTDMSAMFRECTVLNGPANIGNWNTVSVTEMNNIFMQASAFNQPIGAWNTANVVTMAGMFSSAGDFNQSIGSWNTGKVTNMNSMFSGARDFNQPIGAWNAVNVTNMGYMFNGAVAFNRPVGNLNVAKVTNMWNMFAGATTFNQPIGAWNTTSVTNMSGMFSGATTFNQPIGAWNTTSVTNMSGMFFGASTFNQPIGNWKTSQVADMTRMFDQASAFNMHLGNWRLNGTVVLTNMFRSSGLDCDQYSATLIGWSANPATPSGRSLGASGTSYGTSAVSARNNLVTNKGWTISGDVASGSDCPGALTFVTRWNLATSGSDETQLSFGVGTTGTVSYTWQEVSPGTTSGSGTLTGSTATITGLPSGSVIDLKINPTNFHGFFINNGTDKDRLVDVRQWGAASWTSMAQAFYGCANLQISATDSPDLTGVTSMAAMFRSCTVLNGPANIDDWNTEHVTDMNALFRNAAAFNQPVGTWKTSEVTDMNRMFFLAQAFNQPIGSWNTSKVTNMERMFSDASAFDQPIGTWGVGEVTNMTYMFYYATSFNQYVGNWDVSKVSNMSYMFLSATSFNQSLGTWTLNAGVSVADMLSGSGQNCHFYSETLIGWSANPSTPSGRSLGASGKNYGTNAVAARNNLVATKGWTITGDAASGSDCSGTFYFVTRWNLATSGSGDTQLSFGVGTTGTVSYTWQEVSPGTASGGGTFTKSTATITGLPTGSVIDLKINPTDFHGFFTNNGTDKSRLVDVRQWGTASWTSMAQAFYGCANLKISATDYPDLTGVTSMADMFRSCTVLNGPANIGEWNTAHVTDMSALFSSARAFNQPLGTWKTGEVTNMSRMFSQARAFNQPIGNWNTARVTNMSGMFSVAVVFNQPIDTWNTVNVTSMRSMFSTALAFNQPIGHWNTTQVTDMNNMFSGANSFNNYLGDWVLNATVDLTNMLLNSGLDCYYYSATLIGWSTNSATPGGRSLGAGGRSYGTNAEAARNNLVTTKGWTITGDAASGSDCLETLYFVTRWNLATSGSGDTQLSFGVGTTGTVSYTWREVSPGAASGSGTFTGSTATIMGLPVGAVIDLSISPANFNRFRIYYGADKDRLTGILKWGATTWASMTDAFAGCSNLQISATDLPNLNNVTSLAYMFSGCTILDGPSNIGSWETGNVTFMINMFANARAFNQPIGTWNTVKVTNMYGMFSGASAFNQPIANWHTEHVADMQYMFNYAIAFNQPIGTWDTGKVTNMYGMFYGASSFNQPIANWHTENVTNMYVMFTNAIAFNQPIDNWNTTNVTSMASMFSGASAFNQPIGNWNTTNVTSMASMFNKASAFNQPIGNWNTTNVTSMSLMFSNATSFNQSLGAWTLNPGVNLADMLSGSGLDCYYYSTTLNGWSANTSTPSGRSLGAGGRSYGTNAAAAHSNLVTTKGWTIMDDAASGLDCSTPLPVTLVSFSGKKTAENQNTLKWITADEKNFDRFEIQRSSDAKGFEKIDVVLGHGAKGMGNLDGTPPDQSPIVNGQTEHPATQTLNAYTFTDRMPGPSNYYRLKMVDRDGSFQYSRIISMENSADQAVVGSFYPNPSNGKVFVDVYAVESGSWTLTITDAGGRTIGKQVHAVQKGMNKIALNPLSPGLNLVRFEHGQYAEVRKLISE